MMARVFLKIYGGKEWFQKILNFVTACQKITKLEKEKKY